MLSGGLLGFCVGIFCINIYSNLDIYIQVKLCYRVNYSIVMNLMDMFNGKFFRMYRLRKYFIYLGFNVCFLFIGK